MSRGSFLPNNCLLWFISEIHSSFIFWENSRTKCIQHCRLWINWKWICNVLLSFPFKATILWLGYCNENGCSVFSDLKYFSSSQTQISTRFKCSKANKRDEQLANQAGTEELVNLFFAYFSSCWWKAFLSWQSTPFVLITFMRIHSTYWIGWTQSSSSDGREQRETWQSDPLSDLTSCAQVAFSKSEPLPGSSENLARSCLFSGEVLLRLWVSRNFYLLHLICFARSGS